LKPKKERIQINQKFAIDCHVFRELKNRTRKFRFPLDPVNDSDLERLKFKPDVRIIEIKEIWKIGLDKIKNI